MDQPIMRSLIESDRLRMRKAHAADLEGVVETQTDQRVRTYLGGPRSPTSIRVALIAQGVETVTAVPGTYIVADKDTDAMHGIVLLTPRDASLPGHVLDAGGELELSYVFRHGSWGHGYATEAARAVLAAAAGDLADQPILLVTQTANAASMRLADRLGFGAVSTFEQFDAEQTLAVARLHSFIS